MNRKLKHILFAVFSCIGIFAFAPRLETPRDADDESKGAVTTTAQSECATLTGAEFATPSNAALPAFPFVGGQPRSNCPNGNCPLADLSPFQPLFEAAPFDRSNDELPPVAQNATNAAARVYNAYEEELSAPENAEGTMRRNVVEKGSGAFLVDANGVRYVLTAAHIFRDGQGTISVASVDGRRFAARLEFASDACDVALLRLDERPDVMTLTVSQSWPKQGETVWRVGFGPNETLKTTAGVVKGYAKTSKNESFETLKIDGSARQGDSGGPVFNASGEIVGVVWGTDGRDTYATYSGRIMQTLCERNPVFALPKNDSIFAEETPQNVEPFEILRNGNIGVPEAATPVFGNEAVDASRPDANVAKNNSEDNVRSRQNWIDVLGNCALTLACLFTVGYCGTTTIGARGASANKNKKSN